MAINYPSSYDTLSDPQGTSLVTSPDHAELHRDTNTAVELLQKTVGTTAGTAFFADFGSSDKPLQRSGGTVSGLTVQSGTATFNSLSGTASFNSLSGTANFNQLSGTIATLAGGTVNSVVLGTPTVDQFTSSASSTPSKANRALAPQVGTLTDSPGGTISTNAASAQLFELTFGTTAGNRTLATPTNPSDGQSLTYRIKQNAGNTGTIVWDSAFRVSSEFGTPSAGTASTWNYYAWRYNNSDSKWDAQGQVKQVI